RALRADLSVEYEQKLNTFKPGFPYMQELRNRIAALDTEIENERVKITTSLEAEYRAAVAREESLQARMEELKVELQGLRNRSIEYNILSREVDTNRSQYEALLQRLKEVNIVSGVGSSQVSIVDRAQPPRGPFQPNHRKAMLQAVLLSLIGAVGAALALEFIDDTIKTPEHVKSKLGLASIGVVPKTNRKDPIAELMEDSRSPISEAFSSARTALQFATSSGAPKTTLITGIRPSEGKTSTTVALGISFAAVGKRVLIIDADMRKPSFVADAGASAGLSGLLTRRIEVTDQIVAGAVRNLYLLPSGVVPPNPAELLATPRLNYILESATKHFDIVLVDSPPILSFADSPLLSSICESTLLVLQSGAIRRPTAKRAINRLLSAQANIVGVVLTKFNARNAGYGYGYGYGRYGRYALQYNERSVSAAAHARRKVKIFQSANDEHEHPSGGSAVG
ncbi:MAG: polysaccharide biosynthesis tyrosine autokinase, partial [Caulobacterales bacterium]|nr:polysaccharide biosynthesis tyrosine autokinase [Caulobacterales bacterium]